MISRFQKQQHDVGKNKWKVKFAFNTLIKSASTGPALVHRSVCVEGGREVNGMLNLP